MDIVSYAHADEAHSKIEVLEVDISTLGGESTTTEALTPIADGKLFKSSNDKLYWQINDGFSGLFGVGELQLKDREVAAVSVTGYASGIITSDGKLYVCGRNGNGQLGIGTDVDVATFTDTGVDNVAEFLNLYDNINVIKLADGTILGAGYNGTYGLGTGDTVDSNVFIPIGITAQGKAFSFLGATVGLNGTTLYGVGRGDQYLFGNGSTGNLSTAAVILENVADIFYDLVYHVSAFALKTDGTLWATGYNAKGRLGGGTVDDNTPSWFDTGLTDVKDVFLSTWNTFVLKNNGTLWVTGGNSSGQLGLGDTTDRNSFTQVDITGVESVMASYFSTITKQDGSIWVCGYNGLGSLGVGDTTDRLTFFDTGFKVTDNVVYSYTSSRITGGELFMCGRNSSGQLGTGDTTDQVDWVSTGITNVVAVHTLTQSTMVILSDGTMRSVGDGRYGLLSLVDETDYTTFQTPSITGVAGFPENKGNISNDYNQIIEKDDGSIYLCGINYSGIIGNGTTDAQLTLRDTGLDANTNLNRATLYDIKDR